MPLPELKRWLLLPPPPPKLELCELLPELKLWLPPDELWLLPKLELWEDDE